MELIDKIEEVTYFPNESTNSRILQKSQNEVEIFVLEENISQNHPERKFMTKKFFLNLLINLLAITHLILALIHLNRNYEKYELSICSPHGILLAIYFCVYLRVICKNIFTQSRCEEIANSKIMKMILKSWKLISAIAFYIKIVISFGIIAAKLHSNPSKLQSLSGIILIIVFGYFLSAHRNDIKWRQVINGLIFQFFIAILCIEWTIGRKILECMGDKISKFLDFSKFGSSFLFGDFLIHEQTVFAFAILSTIYFFGMIISVLHYLGIIASFLTNLGWIFQKTFDATVCESVNAAAAIFLGITETPMLIRPYIPLLTESEITAIMVSGFSTVSGTVFAVFISFGMQAKHLITASVMNAPASLYYAKLIHPEVEESRTTSSNIQIEKSKDSSLIDAASNGACQGISMILNIIANLIAFISFVEFINVMIIWSTEIIGFDGINLQWMLGKIFIPVSWSIGVEWKDCEAIGNVIGMKITVSEFVAFQKLGKIKSSISERSMILGTFAVCSFAHAGSIGIMIGTLTSLAVERRSVFSKLAIKAAIAGCLVPILTASIVGILID